MAKLNPGTVMMKSKRTTRRLAQECDQAIGALLTDLKERGLLEETLVLWGGEFGRTPTVELPKPGSNAGKSMAGTTITTVSPFGWPGVE